MPGTNQFLPFAVGAGANTLTPTAYAALASLLSSGFSAGVAPSAQFNTALRQATTAAAGLAQFIANQGPNVNDDGNSGAFAALLATAVSGRLLAVRVFTTANNGQAYTPTTGTTSVVVEAVGGGGAGGGGAATSSGSASLGSGGSSGAYGSGRFTASFAGVTLTVGSGGTAVAAANGGNGGTTSFGALLSCPGGNGGNAGGVIANTAAAYSGATAFASAASGANIRSHRGFPSDRAFLISGVSQSGGGGSSLLGNGGAALNVPSSGAPGEGYGAGGGGGSSWASAASAGGNGAPGVIIVWEYA